MAQKKNSKATPKRKRSSRSAKFTPIIAEQLDFFQAPEEVKSPPKSVSKPKKKATKKAAKKKAKKSTVIAEKMAKKSAAKASKLEKEGLSVRRKKEAKVTKDKLTTGNPKSSKKQPMTAAERKRRSRAMKREAGVVQLEIELSYALKSKLEWAAKKEGVTLREYIATTLTDSHKSMV